MQCYICAANCDYNHFNDGHSRKGTCPLFDNHHERHDKEVAEAEQAARAKAQQENPDIAEDHLRIELSTQVKKDEADRIASHARSMVDQGARYARQQQAIENMRAW